MALYFLSGRLNKTPTHLDREKPPDYRTKIEGLSFLAMNAGRKVLAIHADRLIVKNMKVGYFTFSMATVASLDNVSIEIYSAGWGDAQKSESRQKGGAWHERNRKGVLDFKDVFSEEIFSSFPVKKITSIVAAPIVFTLYDGETMITRISSRTATVRFRNQDVIFDGGVSVVSGKTELRCDLLKLSPADGLMEAEQYRMVRENKMTSGPRIKTDLFMKKYL